MTNLNRPDLQDYLFFAFTMVLIVAVGIFAYVMSHLPPEVGTWEFWASDEVAPLQVIGYAVTALIAIVSVGLLLWRNVINTQELREQQKSALADRYKTGAELLSNDKPTVETAGIVVLQELAIEQPDDYGNSIADLLAAHVTQSGRASYKAAISRGPSPSIPDAPGVEPALRALGTIQKRVPDIVREGAVTRTIDRTLISAAYYGIDLSALVFSACVFRFTRFADVVARGARFGNVFKWVTFTRCDLRSARFQRWVSDDDDNGQLELDRCNLEKASIGGKIDVRISRCDLTAADLDKVTIRSIKDCYFTGTPPEIEAYFAKEDMQVLVYDTSGPGTWEGPPNARYFKPGPNAVAFAYDAYVKPPNEDDIPF